ncbi:unnamed protein product [Onchocerca ochengi]|uniref:Secreted protein n=1 Tax=Onchocerca ochengi TaxID=42157 RepID=A0A182E3T9_ONCOC|nr:unnamed protein product [Onchocerca ochengi]
MRVRAWVGVCLISVYGQFRMGIARALCCLSDAGVIAAVMSACSSGSSNLATCFCHRFALDGSAALWDGWDCMQEYSYRVE